MQHVLTQSGLEVVENADQTAAAAAAAAAAPTPVESKAAPAASSLPSVSSSAAAAAHGQRKYSVQKPDEVAAAARAAMAASSGMRESCTRALSEWSFLLRIAATSIETMMRGRTVLIWTPDGEEPSFIFFKQGLRDHLQHRRAAHRHMRRRLHGRSLLVRAWSQGRGPLALPTAF